MPTYYFSITDLEDRLSNLSGSAIASDAQKNTKVRTPAAAWVDSVFPYEAPFADIDDTPATPTIVQMGALEYGVHISRLILTKDPNDEQARIALKNAERLFQIDKDSGLARVSVEGSDARIERVDITRSRPAEEDDERENQAALWP